ncbi:hypothetical protein JB92DRAFT_2871108 [Gautieria morchelliformis]|nr:hypothetical protein JB92DRAFT_2871108 [Gautieria morchelliformis]
MGLAGMVMASPTATVCTTTLSRPTNSICADFCLVPPPPCNETVSCCCTPVTVTIPCY